MITTCKHGDSKIICIDYNNTDYNELINTTYSYFDLINVPVEYVGKDWLGNEKYEPIYLEAEHYFITFYKDYLSNTGYSAMFVNKNREIYKAKIGYGKKL